MLPIHFLPFVDSIQHAHVFTFYILFSFHFFLPSTSDTTPPPYSRYHPHRKVDLFWNPGCDEDFCSSKILKEAASNASNIQNIVYARCAGQNSTLHYLWSTLHYPTLTIIYTPDTNSYANVNWTYLFNSSAPYLPAFSFSTCSPRQNSSSPNCTHIYYSSVYSTTIIFSHLVEMNDYLEKASSSNHSLLYKEHDLSQLQWNDFRLTQKNLSGILKGFFPTKPGSISFKLSFFESAQRSPHLPHLFHTENSSEFTFIIDKLNSEFVKSRFRLHFSVIVGNLSVRKPLSEFTAKTRIFKTIDDEYSPGIFTINEVHISPSIAFMQWRPLFYTQRDPTFENSELTFLEKCDRNDFKNVSFFENDFLLKSLYSGDSKNPFNSSSSSVQSFFITFGREKSSQAAFQSTEYIAWSCITGYNQPQSDKLSLIIILVIVVGFGVPVVIIAFTHIARSVKLHRSSSFEDSSPFAANNEDGTAGVTYKTGWPYAFLDDDDL